MCTVSMTALRRADCLCSRVALKPDPAVGLQAWPAPASVRGKLTALNYEDLGEAGVPGRLYFRKRSPLAFHLSATRRRTRSCAGWRSSRSW